MRKQSLVLFYVLVFVGIDFSCLAQTVSPDAFVPVAEKIVRSHYDTIIGANAQIYNGRKYLPMKGIIEGYPFFKFTNFKPATIQYEDYTYSGIPTLYDAFNDEVIIGHYNSEEHKIRLTKERVASFNIDGHTFINIKSSPENGLPAKQTFYELLYWEGNVKVLARRYKSIAEKIENREAITEFREEYTYYILKDSVYYQVKSKASVLKVFKEHSKELRRNFRKSQLKPYYSNREQAIVYLAKQYSALNTLP